MKKRTWVLFIGLCMSTGCKTQTENNVQAAASDVGQQGASDEEPQREMKAAASRLASGLYRGGLRVAIHDNRVSGYFEDASGWNEQIGAPQFSCEYFFVGEYAGSDTIPISVPDYEGVTGTLEVLSGERIRVTLSLNPCDNEQSTTDLWEIERPYPLMAIKSVTSPKSYFYSTPDEKQQRKAYLVKGDRAEITGVKGEWYQVVYRGASTTEGWMPASAFGEQKPPNPITGNWLSKEGQAYELYYKFYSNGRYKTWSVNSFEPMGMTGSFETIEPGTISLTPCGGTTEAMRFRDPGADEMTLMIPRTSTWTVFEKQSGDSHLEDAAFSIEKRQIVTSVNNRIVRIPSSTTKERFLDAVCPFEVTPDVIEMGEGTFDILRISTHEHTPLFYALLDDDAVIGLVIENPTVQREGIAVGSTFGELRKAIPSVVLTRSEIEGKVVGSDEHFSFSFGYVNAGLFDSKMKTIPDSVKIRQIVL